MLIQESSLSQGSEEWLNWRKLGIGGSEIYSLACRAKHWLKPRHPRLADRITPDSTPPSWITTPRKIWMDKHGLIPPLDPNNPHLIRGHRVEPKVRELAEYTWDCELEQLCGYSEEFPHSRVSLDGYSIEKGILIEVKAPFQLWDHLPDYPVWQIAYQAAVLRKLQMVPVRAHVLEGNENRIRRVQVKDWPILGESGKLRVNEFETLGDSLIEMVCHFWEWYMEPDNPPDLIPRERDILEC